MVEERIKEAVMDIEMSNEMKYRITENVMNSQRKRRRGFNFAPFGLAVSCLLVAVIVGVGILPNYSQKESDRIIDNTSNYNQEVIQTPVKIEGFDVSLKRDNDLVICQYRDQNTGALITMSLLKNAAEPISGIKVNDKSVELNHSVNANAEDSSPLIWNDGENQWLVESDELTTEQLREFLKNFNK